MDSLDDVEEESWKPAQCEHQDDHKQHLVNIHFEVDGDDGHHQMVKVI